MDEVTKLDQTKDYQRILEDLAYLNAAVRLDPADFAETFLFPIAQKVSQLRDDVYEGVI